MSFCGLDKGYGSLIVVVSMVYLEFKLNMSFDLCGRYICSVL